MDEIEMSTKIDDLPGSKEIKYDDLESTIPVIPNEKTESKILKLEQKDIENQKETNIIVKQSLFATIKNEINEENLFLLILFFIISISDINKYLNKIPFVGGNFGEESWSFILIKSIVFLIVFIIGKLYVLPKIQI
jgi:hypothetical protein